MSTQQPQNITQKAAGDLSAGQYLFVKNSGADRTVTTCTAITDVAVGVQQNNECKTAGDPVAVATAGTSKVIAAAAIAVGAKVAPAATGKAQTAVSTQTPRGQALTAAAGANEVIEIALFAGSGAPLP